MKDTRKALLNQIDKALYDNQDFEHIIDNEGFLDDVKDILENYRIEPGDLR